MRSLNSLEKWSYAVGSMPFAVKDAAFVNFVVFYYTQVQGLSGALGWPCNVSGPQLGRRFRSRRRQLVGHVAHRVGAGAIRCWLVGRYSHCHCYSSCCLIPRHSLGEIGVFAWLLGVSILLRTFLTIYIIPHTAMGAELSTDYDERTVIAKARVTMGWLAGYGTARDWLPVFFPDGSTALMAGSLQITISIMALCLPLWRHYRSVLYLGNTHRDFAPAAIQSQCGALQHGAALSGRAHRIW